MTETLTCTERDIHPLRNTGSCEDETHFLIVGPLYKDLRYMLLDPISQNVKL